MVLSGIDPDKSGVASGANATVRQVGGALGVAVIGSLLTTQSIRHTVDNITSAQLSTGLKAHAIARVHAIGINYRPGRGVPARDTAVLEHAVSAGIAAGARPALLFGASAVVVGAVVAMFIPALGSSAPAAVHRVAGVEGFEAFEPLDPSPAVAGDTGSGSSL